MDGFGSWEWGAGSLDRGLGFGGHERGCRCIVGPKTHGPDVVSIRIEAQIVNLDI